MDPECPQSGKIFILLIFSMLFSGILLAINCLDQRENIHLYNTSIFISIVQVLFMLYLLYLDLFKKCDIKESCQLVKGCKWLASTRFKYVIILLSGTYLLSYGIINIDSKEIISNTAMIIGTIGILYILSDIVCSIGCSL